MSTDSESSIDWLESDHEESEQEEDNNSLGERDQGQCQPSTPDHALSSPPPPPPPNAIHHHNALKRQHSSPPSTSQPEQLFARKCRELQCYIPPLSLILNGLRSGRYRERLSTFQESVAMDRIQRIMGVLRNPGLGDKYIHILLKMEVMLKSWFPQVKLLEQPPTTQTEEPVPSKKAKLCSSATVGPFTSTEPASGPKQPLSVTDLTPPAAYSASNLKWLHTSPICSPTAERGQSARDRDLTQDCAVSSSTDCPSETTTAAPRGPQPPPPPLGKINAPCLERLLRSTESIITQRMDSHSS